MADNKIELGVNDQTTIQLPSRGSSGLRIVFTISDPSVVSVTRKELQSAEVDSLHLRPGDPVPAIFIIKGLKNGATTIHFSERKPGMNDGADIALKEYEVKVKE